MKTENEILDDMKGIEENTIDVVCDLLRAYDASMQEYLANITASLCGISFDDIMTNTRNIDSVQARWLFWYAYRYMTNESYESIANKCRNYRRFSASCVGASIAKMAMMISKESVWAKRWTILKRIVKIMLKNINDEDVVQTITLTVTHPKGVTVALKQD